MPERLYLITAHLSTDASVEHLPKRRMEPLDLLPARVETKCGKFGHWSRRAPRKGTVCQRCSASGGTSTPVLGA